MAHKQLNTFHLFAGAGGGILADLLLGHNPIGACEIEKYPRDVLLARQRDGIFPNFPVWDDICTLDGGPWKGKVDVVCGGFPCQDISAAGKGEGITGSRSGLWGEMARVIREMGPRFVFVENSPMLTSRGLGTVLGDLAAMGYDARWCVLGACDAGAPHKRDRIWILADANSSRGDEDSSDGELWSDRAEQSSNDSRLADQTEGREISGWWDIDPAEISDADLHVGGDVCGKELGAKEFAVASITCKVYKTGEPKTESESIPAEPLVGRVAHRVASRVDRLKAIGNGQVPQCAALAWHILRES